MSTTYLPDHAAQAAIDRHLDAEEAQEAYEQALADAALDVEEGELVEDLWAIEWAAEDRAEARAEQARDDAGWDQ